MGVFIMNHHTTESNLGEPSPQQKWRYLWPYEDESCPFFLKLQCGLAVYQMALPYSTYV